MGYTYDPNDPMGLNVRMQQETGLSTSPSISGKPQDVGSVVDIGGNDLWEVDPMGATQFSGNYTIGQGPGNRSY